MLQCNYVHLGYDVECIHVNDFVAMLIKSNRYSSSSVRMNNKHGAQLYISHYAVWHVIICLINLYCMQSFASHSQIVLCCCPNLRNR